MHSTERRAIERREPYPAAHFNRLLETQLAACGGIKSLYLDSFYPRADFDLYDECVLRASRRTAVARSAWFQRGAGGGGAAGTGR